jgi:hypothetical protein
LNYVLRHWRGEIPLVKAFLLNGVAVYFAAAAVLVVVGVGSAVSKVSAPPVSSIINGILIVAFAVVFIWSLVGIFRASLSSLLGRRPAYGTSVSLTDRVLGGLGIVLVLGALLMSARDLAPMFL